MAWVFGAPPQRTKQYFLALRSPNTTILGSQKHLCWPVGYAGRCVWGATPETKQYSLALRSSNTTILGIQKHLCWPIEYSGLGGWSATLETKTIFFGTAQSKHHHPRYQKIPLLAYGVQWYECLERHPRNQNNIWHDAVQTPPA